MIIEQIIIQYLTEALSVPVYAQRPERPDPQYVIVEKTASSNVNFITTSTIAIQSYANRLLEAAQLNETVKAAMDDLPDLPTIGKAKLTSDYNFTNTTAKQYRYQAVYNITHY